MDELDAGEQVLCDVALLHGVPGNIALLLGASDDGGGQLVSLYWPEMRIR